MSVKWKWGGWLASVALFIGLMVSGNAALAYTVSGTVTNSSGAAGRVYVMLASADGSTPYFYGTSIASVANNASAGYTIHGVPGGSYSIAAYVDRLNTGSFHIYDSANTSASFSVSGTTTAPAFTIGAPPNPTAPSSVGQVNVATASNGAFVQWGAPSLAYGGGGPEAELADSYVIYWGTSPNPGNGSTPAGSKTLSACGSGDYHVFIGSGLTAGTAYYFTVKALNPGGSAFSSTAGSYTITAPTGGTTVSGRVYSPTITNKSSSTPMYIALVPDNGQIYFAEIGSPVDTQPWSITGVQPGRYSVYAILDLNNDGFSTDVGKALSRGVQNGASPSVLILSGAASATAPDLTLTAPNSHTSVTTQNSGNYWYSLMFHADNGLKRPTNITVNSGPAINEALDIIGLRQFGNFSPQVTNLATSPSVGDTYSVTVKYSDGSSETLSPKVTGVVTNFPAPLFPQGTTGPINTNSTPFAWTTPSPLPTGYYDYALNMNGSAGLNYSQFWNPQNNTNSNMPSTQLSIAYNSDGSAPLSQLTSGTYNWGITVADGYGNQGWGNGANISPQSGGPTISGFSPTTGGAGTSVTINGSGFSGATNVSFGGVTATVTSNSGSQITATVPANAPVGPITVTANNITGASSVLFQTTVTYSGLVKNRAGTPISGATVTVENSSPVVSTTTDGSGNFAINLPSGVPCSLRVSQSGYRDILSGLLLLTGNYSGNIAYTLLTDSDLSNLGLSVTSKGLIATSVTDWDTGAKRSGATLTATSFLHPDTPYTVYYTNPSGGLTSSGSTYTDGLFYVPNVDEGDIVAVTATLSGYVTQPRTYVTHTGVVSQTKVNVTPIPAVSVSPTSGSTITTAQQVTLTVSNAVTGDSYNIVYTTDGSDPTTSVTRTVVTATSASFTLSAGTNTVKYFAINNNHGDAGSVATATYTVNPATYNLTVGISGNGTVNSVSGPSVSCSGSGCPTTAYTAGSAFTLAATPSNSLFSGWSGTGSASGCTGTGTCSFTLNADTTVTATFVALPPVEVVGPSTNYFSSLSGAYGTLPASSSATMLAQGVALAGSLNLSNSVQLILHGGYDNAFANQTGVTILQGVLTVGYGSLTIDDFVISQ